MTVVEREVVVTERERRARVLEAAALEIDVRGWTRRDLIACNGQVCAAGAIGLASGLAEDALEAADGAYSHTLTVFDGKPRNQLSLCWLPSWNDSTARDAEEVKFLLRWRAEEIRDGR